MNRDEKIAEMTARQKALQATPGGIKDASQVSEWMGLVAGVEQLSALPPGSDVTFDAATNRWQAAPDRAAETPVELPTRPSQPDGIRAPAPTSAEVARALRQLADLLDPR